MSRRRAFQALALLVPLLIALWWWQASPRDPVNARMAYTDHSYRPHGEVLACLGSGLGLGPGSTADELVSPAMGLTVRVENRHDFQKIWVWLEQGRSLTAAQIAAVRLCTGRPDNRP